MAYKLTLAVGVMTAVLTTSALALPELPPLPPLPGMPALAAPKTPPIEKTIEPTAPVQTGEYNPDPDPLPQPPAVKRDSAAAAPMDAPPFLPPLPEPEGLSAPALNPPKMPALPDMTSTAAPANPPAKSSAASPAAESPFSGDISNSDFALPPFLTREEAEAMEIPLPPLADSSAQGTTADEAELPVIKDPFAEEDSQETQKAESNAPDAIAKEDSDGFFGMFGEGELSAPTLPTLPDFTEITEPKGNQEAGSSEELAAPDLPKMSSEIPEIEDSFPSWMFNDDLPARTPLEEPVPLRAEGELAEPKQEPVLPNRPTVADLNKKAKQEDTKTADNNKDTPTEEVAENNSEEEGAEGTEEVATKEVEWPRNFKTQLLPGVIYKKQYDKNNRHLPQAVYHQDREMRLFQAVANNHINGVRALINVGVPLTIRSGSGENLLMVAARYQAADALRLLVMLGANPLEVDTAGRTALHYAAQLGRFDMVSMLLQAGGQPDQPDAYGVTAYNIARMRGDGRMMQLLGQYRYMRQAQTQAAQHQQGQPIARYMR